MVRVPELKLKGIRGREEEIAPSGTVNTAAYLRWFCNSVIDVFARRSKAKDDSDVEGSS